MKIKEFASKIHKTTCCCWHLVRAEIIPNILTWEVGIVAIQWHLFWPAFAQNTEQTSRLFLRKEARDQSEYSALIFGLLFQCPSCWATNSLVALTHQKKMAQEDIKKRPPTMVMNSQQMLREIRESLLHLRRQPQDPKCGVPVTEVRTTAAPTSENAASSITSTPGIPNSRYPLQNRRFSGSGHAETLAKIRSSLEPYAASESGYSSCSESTASYTDGISRAYLKQLVAIGYDEVSYVILILFSYIPSIKNLVGL